MSIIKIYIVFILCCFAIAVEGNGKVDSLVSNGYELLTIREYEAAKHSFGKAVKHDPDHVGSYLGRAEAERLLGNYEEALKDIYKVLSIDGKCAEAYYVRGKVHQKMEKYPEAIIDFNTALEYDKEILKAIALKANTYLSLGETRQAEKLLDNAINDNPDYGDYYFFKGKISASRNKYEQAVEHFNIAFTKETKTIDKIDLYINRGEAYLKTAQFINAKGDFEKALILDKENASVLHGLGVANYNLTNYSEALKNFNRSLEIIAHNSDKYEDNPETFYNMGMTYYRMEDLINACKYFHIGCKMNNKNSCKMMILQCTGK